MEVIPNCGCRSETYDFFGADYRVPANATEDESGTVKLWEGSTISETKEIQHDPNFVSNGTYAEPDEFLSALQEDRDPNPMLKDVLQSVELCDQILKEFD